MVVVGDVALELPAVRPGDILEQADMSAMSAAAMMSLDMLFLLYAA
ncbi:MAG TPA: hypothetical protein VN649_04575 [Ramlibacter sp.]|nr:hypothetical protein [Ramlibacter sp.]